MRSFRLLLLLIFLWMLVQAWSFWAPTAIEGPRNIDTGFKRLDVWFSWQLVALAVAIVSAIFGFFTNGKRLWNRILGLMPIGITVLIAAAVFIFASYGPNSEGDRQTGTAKGSPPRTTTQTAE